MKMDRDLRFYEQICARMNVSFMLDVEISGLNKADLNDALRYVKIKHPYLRMKMIKNDDTGGLRYVEMVSNKEFDPIEVHVVDNLDDFNNWQEKLIDVAKFERDFEKSLIFLDVYSLINSNKHRIYGCINHSGIDGPGMFTVVKDLLHFLDRVLSNIEFLVDAGKFLDIHKEYNTKRYDLETLKNEPVITENFLPGFKPIPDEHDSCSPYVSAEFYQFDEATSQNLVENCRHHKATVQGAVSIATLIALLDTHKQDVSKPVKAINIVPCNMRGLLEPKLTNDDLVCGSAGLTWPQDVKEDDDVWTLVAEATSNMHKLRESMYGYKWWIKLANSLPFQPYSIMSSSIGLINLSESELKNITVNDVRMLGGSYGVPENAANNMTHVFTALGRLTVVMSYTYPTLSKQWAKKFVQVQSEVLKYLSSSNKPKTLNEFLK